MNRNGTSKKRPPQTSQPPEPPPGAKQKTFTTHVDEEFLDEDVFLDETLIAEDEENLILRDAEKREALASRLIKWARPALSHAYTSQSQSIIFQQLEIDYVIGESNRELLPDRAGPAAVIRIFGVTGEGHSVCCNVHGFEPYFYINCPAGMGPDDISHFQHTLEGRMREVNRGSKVPKFVRRIEMVHKKSIMYYQQQSLHPFLKIVVALPTMVASCRGILDKGIHIDGLGTRSFMTYESNVLFALRFMIDCNVVGGNWIEMPAGKYKKTLKGLSYCQLEFDCLYSDLISHAPEGEFSKMAPFRILSFDIECAGRKGHFPEPTHDPVIQVANLVTSQGEDQPFIRNVMTLNSCSPIVGVDVMAFDTEREVLLAWRDFIREVDPDVIIGYNICKFDLPYLIERAEKLGIAEFPVLGRTRNSRQGLKKSCHLKGKTWSRLTTYSVKNRLMVVNGLLVGWATSRKKNSVESSAAPTSNIPNMANDAMEQFKAEVREEVKNEIREEVTNEIRGEMEAQLGAILQRLSLMNPSLNLNLDGILLP